MKINLILKEYVMLRLKVNTRINNYKYYDIIIENNFNNIIKYFSNSYKNILILTDNNIYNLYVKGKELSQPNIYYYTITAGEGSKTRSEKSKIEDTLAKLHLTKHDLMIAFGGGVVSDLCGFTASTYKRGIDWVIFSTTLLSMVDASIGGKTGINTHFGKNQIGSIYPPKRVYCGIDYLKTLPNIHIKSGLIELLKHFILFDKEAFDKSLQLINNNNLQELITSENFIKLLYKSIGYKKKVVEKDPYEKGFRSVLNIGHTIGHAIEHISNTITHGEAVAIGLLIEFFIQYKRGYINISCYDRILKMLERLNINYRLVKQIDINTIVKLCLNDKKNISKSQIEFVKLKSFGRVSRRYNIFLYSLTIKDLEEILNEFKKYI